MRSSSRRLVSLRDGGEMSSQRALRGFSSLPKPQGARRRLWDFCSICSMTVGSSTWLRIAIHFRRWSKTSR
ncbi:MAG: hypothetical protein IPQ09_13765 [Myxococcales bacterium]|nr:hypothetical protein [Myxococcales bacterium]